MERLNVDIGIRRCLMNGCDATQRTRGVCGKHYMRLQRDGILATTPQTRKKCSHCDEWVASHGFCAKHLRRWKTWGDPLMYHGFIEGVACAAADCDEVGRLKGLCQLHYNRQRAGVPLDYQGRQGRTRWVDANGYVWIAPNGRRSAELEHRSVMQARLGRALVKGENVHHINGNRADNRIENLELWNTSQPAGQRIPDKVAWAINLLKQYNPDALSPELRIIRSNDGL